MNRPRLDMHRTIFYSTHLQAYTEHTAIHLSTIIFIQRTVRSEKCTQWKIFFILPPSFPPTFSPLSLAPYYFLNHPPHLLPPLPPPNVSPIICPLPSACDSAAYSSCDAGSLRRCSPAPGGHPRPGGQSGARLLGSGSRCWATCNNTWYHGIRLHQLHTFILGYLHFIENETGKCNTSTCSDIIHKLLENN